MAEEIDGGHEHLAWVADGRQRTDLSDIVDVARPRVRGESIGGHHIVDNFIEPELQAVLVLAYQIEHGLGHRHAGIGGIALQRAIGCREVENELVLQHDAHSLVAFDLERAELERLGAGNAWPALGQKRSGA